MIKEKRSRKQQPEYELQKAICRYVSIQYPNVPFLSDTIAAVKLSLMQGVRNRAVQKNGFKTPDLALFYPSGKYHGLFIELKVESPFKKCGGLKSSEHLEGQQKSIDDLNALGYMATFSWGFDMTKNLIDDYMNNRLS